MKDRKFARFAPRSAGILLLTCYLLVCSSCTLFSSNNQYRGPSSPPEVTYSMTFSPSASYADILRGLTNLGVQPAVFCGYPQDFADGSAIQGSVWLPAGQRTRFQQEHRMFVVQTIAHAPDWATKIYALPGAHRPKVSLVLMVNQLVLKRRLRRMPPTC